MADDEAKWSKLKKRYEELFLRSRSLAEEREFDELGKKIQALKEGKSSGGIKSFVQKGAGLMTGAAVAAGSGKGAGGEASHPSGLLFIVLAASLYLSDVFFTGFNGIDFELFLSNFSFNEIGNIIKWAFNSLVAVSLVMYWVFQRPDKREFISFAVLIMLVSFIVSLGGLEYGLIHFLFIAIFYFMFIKAGSKDAATANYVVALLLFLDFFGYGIFTYYLKGTAHASQIALVPEFANRLVFPVWFIYALVYSQEHERNLFTSLLTVCVIGLYIFYFVGTVPQINNISAQLTEVQKQEAVNFFKKTINNFKETVSRFSTNIEKGIEERIKYAITGKVEENRYEPLGVYLEDVKAAEPKFYTDEKVIILGNVKARTLDDMVNVDVGCFRLKDNKKFPAKVDPDKTFSIFTLEEQDFVCEFKENTIEAGSNTITAFANFNFDTLAYLKSYFIDRDRLRAMTREGLDPFDEFGIKDKNPVAIYTNGPVGIDMSTTSSLIGVGSEPSPRLNINLVNRPGWEGRINRINEFVVAMPKGIKMTDTINDCTRPFIEYRIKDCKESCVEFVSNPCSKVQNGELCKKAEEKCLNECKNLFEDSEIVYELNTKDLKIRDELKDIDRFRSFSCKLTLKPEVLENTPLTTRFFKARARYNYTVEKKVAVSVDLPPGFVKSAAVRVSRELNDFISNEAGGKGIAIGLAHGLISQESSFRHCRDGSENCDKDGVNCNNFDSCGIMQLNRKAHCAWFKPEMFTSGEIDRNMCKDGYNNNMAFDKKIWDSARCEPEQTAYSIKCNIKLGLSLLKDDYDTYANNNDLYANTVNAQCLNPSFKGIYLGYNDWDRALRAYNGFGCSTGADTSFIANVNEKVQSIEVVT